MLKKHLEFQKKRTLIIAMAVGLAFIFTCIFVGYNLIQQDYQDEVLKTTESFYQFQEDVGALIESNILLLKGYLAYVQTFEDTDETTTYEYLSYLTEENIDYIRNIAIIKDTTIIYNFPIEGNESSIGVDLALNENQRAAVLRTKEEFITAFVGPINLVQGGRGFIIRLPIRNGSGSYWGQMSIVLKADEVLELIDQYAYEVELEYLIENPLNDNSYIAGNEAIDKNISLYFDDGNDLINWVMYVQPIKGWHNTEVIEMALIVVSIILGSLASVLIYILLKANHQMKYNSLHDRLTGLLNRLFLDDYSELLLADAQRSKRPIGLILIDLNDFKMINDTYGHKIGDEVLKKTAEIIVGVTRSNEAVFRLGGDEFLLIAPNLVDKSEVVIIKDRIEEKFRNDFNIPDHKISMIPSVGTGIYPDHGESLDEVMHYADKEMYREKEKHKSFKYRD